MQQKNIDSILKEALENAKPSKGELEKIDLKVKDFLKIIEKRIKSLKLGVEIFVGGSYAKRTMIRKHPYDIDIFLRFDKKYNDKEISNLTKKILSGINKKEIKGSRDYFRIDKKGFFIEIIPVTKVNKPGEAKNITDLSYLHVNYIRKKIKSDKILDEVRLGKAFCYANNCYGAESFIKGFSGYGIELLIYHYGSFLKFIKSLIKIKEKEIIDIEKDFKNKQEILLDINESKLGSPVVLVDPTYKYRNVLAALSEETFGNFKRACNQFLKKPSLILFKPKIIDLNKIKEKARKKKQEFIFLKAKTNKQEGDIAGSKLLKFYNHLSEEINEFFLIKNKGFNYANKKSADLFFVVIKRKEIVKQGPKLNQKENVKLFKKSHKITFTKSNRIYARDKINFNINQFMNNWKKKNSKKIKEMSVIGLNAI